MPCLATDSPELFAAHRIHKTRQHNARSVCFYTSSLLYNVRDTDTKVVFFFIRLTKTPHHALTRAARSVAQM